MRSLTFPACFFVAAIVVGQAAAVFSEELPSALNDRGGSTDDEIRRAHKTAGILAMDRLRLRDKDAHASLLRCPPRGILLVDGIHDHTDRVLRGLGVRFQRCSAESLPRRSLAGVHLVIVDCAGTIGTESARRLANYVERGGTLLTTDWALLHVLETAFPGTVRYSRRPTRDDVVRISYVDAHPLMRWVFPPGRPACWWIENRSFPIDIIARGRRRVHTLLRSREMGRKYGSPTLAVTFRWGRGDVVHVVSHTYLQRNELRSPWEFHPATREAEALGIPAASPAFQRLKKTGELDQIRAGHLNAALSIQQFLLNIIVHSLRHPVPHPPVRPVPPPVRPRPPPTPPPPPRPQPIDTATHVEAVRNTALADRAGGEPHLHVPRGLRLRVTSRRNGWLQVETPAGQTGWIRREDVRE